MRTSCSLTSTCLLFQPRLPTPTPFDGPSQSFHEWASELHTFLDINGFQHIPQTDVAFREDTPIQLHHFCSAKTASKPNHYICRLRQSESGFESWPLLRLSIQREDIALATYSLLQNILAPRWTEQHQHHQKIQTWMEDISRYESESGTVINDHLKFTTVMIIFMDPSVSISSSTRSLSLLGRTSSCSSTTSSPTATSNKHQDLALTTWSNRMTSVSSRRKAKERRARAKESPRHQHHLSQKEKGRATTTTTRVTTATKVKAKGNNNWNGNKYNSNWNYQWQSSWNNKGKGSSKGRIYRGICQQYGHSRLAETMSALHHQC